ncbi:MAG TPA: energy transducer TonB [Terriglobales bacterium]|jgi:protein TonB|nr:energy transducer TonB [Terriglobales bacterium]
MNERWLVSSFTASSLIHLGIIPLAALVMHAKPLKPVTVPIELVDVPRLEEPKKVEVAPPPPAPKPKPKNITAPKLLSKPVLETTPLPPTGNTKEEIKEKPPEPLPLASLPDNTGAAKAGWNEGSKAAQAEGSAAGAGNLFGKGDVGVVGGSGVAGGGGGTGTAGLGRGAKGDGGGTGSGEALSGLARPLGGYQVKPRYPESARRAGVQGVTTLRVHVLENGRVSEVIIDQSAGFRDLDLAAADAVKKWLFEPARQGKNPVAVWVMLPVKFELH